MTRNAAQRQIQEIRRMQEAIAKTKSPYLKRDYEKRIARAIKEIEDYCRLYDTKRGK